MIAICGKTCSGKDTILRELIELNYSPIITYTSRPKRDGEVDGIDYHFISDDTFDNLKSKDFFAETTEYKVATQDIWKYGTARKDLADDKVIIINPEGLKNLKNDKSLNITAFLLIADERTLWNRLRKRGDNSDEAHRRLAADKRDFEDINECIDYAIRTDGNLDIKHIAKLIDEIYKQEVYLR